MIWTHLRPLTRRTTALAALVLFLSGSNYCLIGALRGTPMACTAIAGEPASGGSHCASHAATRSSDATPQPAPDEASAGGPCCVILARTAPPDVAREDAGVSLLPALAVLVAAYQIPVPATVSQAAVLWESPPTTAWNATAHAGRAPPLS